MPQHSTEQLKSNVKRLVLSITNNDAECLVKPIIKVSDKQILNFEANLLIDTGSELSLIKYSRLWKKSLLNKKDVYYLSGIGKGTYRTLGSIYLNILNRPAKFHVVSDHFPIKTCGILGGEFLRENSASVNYDNEGVTIQLPPLDVPKPCKIIVPARTRKLVTLCIDKSSDVSEGYLERLEVGKGIILGENLARVINGKAKVFAINTTMHDVEISLPPVKLQDVDIYDPHKNLSNDVPKHSSERVEKLLKLFDFSGLNDEEKSSVIDPISRFSNRFYIEGDVLEATDLVTHTIKTSDNTPVFQRQYRPAETLNKEIDKQITDLKKNKIIEDSDSPYNSPVWIVPKKPGPDGQKRWRMVMDFRRLNDLTIKDSYPLPNITSILDQLGGAQYFSILDLAMGFHQIKMHPDSKSKTAFSTPFGHYHFNRMPFGLKNAPSTFQRLVDRALSGLQNVELFVYMDDIVIYAKTLKEHTRKFTKLLERLDKAKLTLQPEKCLFLRKEVTYLGHVITKDGVKPDPQKVEAVRKFPRPRTPRNIKQFLGLAGYYRKFIKDFSIIAKPLSYLLKKEVKFKWTEAQDEAFNKLKDILCTHPLLQYPNFTKDFIVTSDASQYGIGGVLSQNFDGKILPVAYSSRTLIDAEINYSTIEKELLGILFSVESFRPYLFGRSFKLQTDHKPLIWLHNMKNPNSRLLRWRHRLSEYDHDIEYIKGSKNTGADALSRNPCDITEEVLNGITNDITLNDDVDPLEMNPHPHSSNFVDESESDTRIETVFLNIHWADNSDKFKNSSKCQIVQNDDFAQCVTSDSFRTTDKEIARVDLKNNFDSDEVTFLGNRQVDCSHEIARVSLNDFHEVSGFEGQRVDNHTWIVRQDSSSIWENNNILGSERRAPDQLGGETIVNDGGNIIEDSETSDEESQSNLEFVEKLNLVGDLKNHVDTCYPLDNSSNNPNFTCIKISKDNLYMRDDNLAIFIPADRKFTTETNSQLINNNKMKIEDLNNEDESLMEVGNVIAFKYEEFCVFNLVVKPTFDSKPSFTDVVSTLHALKVAMDQMKITSVSISRVGNGLNQISWPNVESEIKKIFGQDNYSITICYAEVEIPHENDIAGIIREFHSSTSGGHKGATKTFERIRENFYWPNMRNSIRNFVRDCETCKLNKLVRQKTKQPMSITDTPSEAFEKIEMDIVGPLPETENGNKYILTIQDNLTKYSIATPLRRIDSVSIANAFSENFITKFGCPQIVHTDQGRDFTSKLMENLCKILKIKQLRSTAFHPQSLGSLERSHHVLIQYLKNFCQKSNWDRWVPYAMFSYNTSKHEGTGFTPHELIYGKCARFPSEFSKRKLPLTYDLFLKTLSEKLIETQTTARDKLHAAKEKSKRYYDLKLNSQNYEEGDSVYLQKNNKTSKLDPDYSGPYKIIKLLEDNNVELQITPSKTKIVHTNLLRPQVMKIF